MAGTTNAENAGERERSLIRRETMPAAAFLVISAMMILAVLTGLTQRFDELAWNAFQRMRSDHLDLFVRQLTGLGNLVTLVMFSIGLAVTLRFGMNSRDIGFIAATLVGGRLLHMMLRAIVDRPRPMTIETLFSIDSSSFPSGHAMMSAVVYPTFALLLAEHIDERRVRNGILIAAFLLAASIGVSRLYLGMHYVTDVIAGWSAGLFWLSACWEFRARRRCRRGPEIASQ